MFLDVNMTVGVDVGACDEVELAPSEETIHIATEERNRARSRCELSRDETLWGDVESNISWVAHFHFSVCLAGDNPQRKHDTRHTRTCPSRMLDNERQRSRHV